MDIEIVKNIGLFGTADDNNFVGLRFRTTSAEYPLALPFGGVHQLIAMLLTQAQTRSAQSPVTAQAPPLTATPLQALRYSAAFDPTTGIALLTVDLGVMQVVFQLPAEAVSGSPPSAAPH